MTAQKSIHEAFLWVRQVYDEGRVFLRDAQKMADALGYRSWEDWIYTSYGASLVEGGYPFAYFGYLLLSPASAWDDEGPGKAALIAIDFHSTERDGPFLFAGSVQYSEHTNVAKAVNDATRLRGLSNYFESVPSGGGDVYVHRLKGSPKGFKGVEEFRHVEIPLTAIDSPEKLRKVVDATIAFVAGDERPLQDVRVELVAAAANA